MNRFWEKICDQHFLKEATKPNLLLFRNTVKVDTTGRKGAEKLLSLTSPTLLFISLIPFIWIDVEEDT